MKARRFFRGLLSLRDWVYLLGLLVPLVIYDLSLKAASVASFGGGDLGFLRALDLMRSEVFFSLGYALVWVGVFAAARRGFARWIAVVLFHAVTMLVVVVVTCAHQYYRENGTTLDYGTIAEWIPKFREIGPILTGDVPLSAWVLLAAALVYAAFGPYFVARAAERWWARRQGRRLAAYSGGRVAHPLVGSMGLWLLALGFVFLSSLAAGPAGTGKSFARESFVNVVLTGVEEATAEEVETEEGPGPVSQAANTGLASTPWTEKRNVVLIHLESTRAQSVTPYNEELATMPFLNELSKSSLFVERAYTTVPRSSKASVSANCGVEPPLYPGPEFEPDGVPARCLAELLQERGYNTVFFASTLNNMDNFGDVAKGFGYEEIYSAETMDTEGFEVTNTFGYEDDIMLEPSKAWLENRNPEEPFMAEYFTGTGHYGYECMTTRHGTWSFSEDEELNRYHNCLRLQDIFLESLFEQYEELGLYEETIFVIFGDHGEGFNEHGRSMHGDTIYEEGLKVPLLVHAPGWFEGGERVEGLASQIDILPTVLEMLGYEVEGGEYPGYSLLQEPPEDRQLMFSCISPRKCLASTQGHEKYIYHYGDLPDEVFDLSADPLEQNDLSASYDEEDLEGRRRDLLAWRSSVNAGYGGEE